MGFAADGRVYALKQINLEGMNRAEREESIDEVRAARRLVHRPRDHCM